MKKAFVMGSNGPSTFRPLDFAVADAERITLCLGGPTCGFKVEFPETGSDEWGVRKQLTRAAASCTINDIFVCYFSGHGAIDNGLLYLMWDTTDKDHLWSTGIPVSEIMEVLRRCDAHSKLLILDCCHAGTVVHMKGLKDSEEISVKKVGMSADNFVVLMASDRLEKARELRELRGSFLTANICDALTLKIAEADKDTDNRISLEDLQKYLTERAKKHNTEHPKTAVPYPYIFGQMKGGFFLTVDESEWVPYEFELTDGSLFVVLPIRMGRNEVLCIGKYPVTNFEWRKTGMAEPVGEKFSRENGWTGPFHPWGDKDFGAADFPVVCISLEEAEEYCRRTRSATVSTSSRWGSIRLLKAEEWDFIAFRNLYARTHPDTWLHGNGAIHHNTMLPANIDKDGIRANLWGVSDMIGNVWEWCASSTRWHVAILGDTRDLVTAELRGGSYLDDMRNTKPFISARELKDGVHTRHSDLGFRVIGEFAISQFPEEVQQRIQLLGRSYEDIFSDTSRSFAAVVAEPRVFGKAIRISQSDT